MPGGRPWWLSSKESTCKIGDMAGAAGSIPGWGRSPGEGNGSPLQLSCLENLWTRSQAGYNPGACTRAGHKASRLDDNSSPVPGSAWSAGMHDSFTPSGVASLQRAPCPAAACLNSLAVRRHPAISAWAHAPLLSLVSPLWELAGAEGRTALHQWPTGDPGWLAEPPLPPVGWVWSVF